MRRTYKYRIYPSHAQITRLEQTLALCCELYNAGLQERRDAWRINRTPINYYAQAIQLPDIKSIRPEAGLVHSQVLQDVLRRLDKAFDAFFRRVKAGEKAGFPRFRSRSRYDSFTYSQSGFAIEHGKLRLSKIGKVKFKQHRPIEGKIKTLTITRTSIGKWFAYFTAEVEHEPLPDGQVEEKRLAKANRKLSAAAKGTPERKKRRKAVAHVHERMANKRRNFAHQESRKLVNRYSIIVFENLNICGMLKNHCLAKSISDAAWNQFVQFTAYKAAYADRKCTQVNARNTSKTCSRCGELVEKDLSVRVHACSICGLTLDRDHNAAINILTLGLQSLGQSTIEAAHL